MTGGRLAPDSQEAEGCTRGFDRGSHWLHQAMSPVRMVDHCLAGFADASEVGTFEGIVPDEIAV